MQFINLYSSSITQNLGSNNIKAVKRSYHWQLAVSALYESYGKNVTRKVMVGVVILYTRERTTTKCWILLQDRRHIITT